MNGKTFCDGIYPTPTSLLLFRLFSKWSKRRESWSDPDGSLTSSFTLRREEVETGLFYFRREIFLLNKDLSHIRKGSTKMLFHSDSRIETETVGCNWCFPWRQNFQYQNEESVLLLYPETYLSLVSENFYVCLTDDSSTKEIHHISVSSKLR